MIKFFIFFLILFTSSYLKGGEISGLPKIIDGDTIHINTYKIRLEGIDAPEIRQTCKKSFFKFSFIIGFTLQKDYSCGVDSKKELIKKIDNSEVNCSYKSRDRYKRYLSTCFKDKINLNKWMVRNGYAVSYKKYSKKYLDDEKYAKKNKLGIWRGDFTRPEKWRKLN